MFGFTKLDCGKGWNLETVGLSNLCESTDLECCCLVYFKIHVIINRHSVSPMIS